MLAAAAHNALVVEPMIILAVSEFAHYRSEYLRTLLRLHVLAVPAAVLATALGAFAVQHVSLRTALISFGVAGLYCLTVLLRRGFLLLGAQGLALVLATAYALFSFVVLFLLLTIAEETSGHSPILAIGVGALSAASIGLAVPPVAKDSKSLPYRPLVRAHLQSGAWLLGQAAARWFTPNFLFLILPFSGTFALVGYLRASLVLVMPLSLFLGALSPILLEWFATKKRASLGSSQPRSVLRSAIMPSKAGELILPSLILFCVATYALALLIFGRIVGDVLLSGANPVSSWVYQLLLSIIAALEGLSMVASTWFKAVGLSSAAAKAAVLAASLTIAYSLSTFLIRPTLVMSLFALVLVHLAYLCYMSLSIVRSQPRSDRVHPIQTSVDETGAAGGS